MASATERSIAVEGLRTAGDFLQLVPRIGAIAIAFAWMAGITYLSSIPGSSEPGPWWMGVLWNGGHAPLFGFLALAWALTLPRFAGWPKLERKHLALILGLVIAFGVADEFHQRSTPGRDFSMLDVITDGTGAACTLWIVRYVSSDLATDRGLAKRVAICVLLCTLAAADASFVGGLFPDIEWL